MKVGGELLIQWSILRIVNLGRKYMYAPQQLPTVFVCPDMHSHLLYKSTSKIPVTKNVSLHLYFV